MTSKETTKRPLEDAVDDTPVKRGRGRPRKYPPKEKVPGRGRGRPRKDPNASPKPKVEKVPGRGRGRPRKDENSATPTKSSAKSPGVGRGRPKKEVTDSLSLSKLSQLVGTYEIKCQKVEEEWPTSAGEMSISISALPHTKACLIASFSLGIVDGTMLLSAQEKTVMRVSDELDDSEGDEEATDDFPDPTVKNGRVYFAWRGRGDEEQVYRGHTGIADFKAPDFTSFKARSDIPGLGDVCVFTGKKVQDEPEGSPEPWSAFPDAA
ncbi:unnamed protein product [Periconia digitata]|uniref:Uncharacterized protein n=1 Tax=Periconia digitata TaxID=1303443 RepID=A0A9W4U4U8_9PLEO|nr:unnamed protein product [Periconia digitata]